MIPDPALQAARPLTKEKRQPSRKNIVICCDGTGNDYSQPNPLGPHDKKNGCNSNVVKLYTTLTVDNDQFAYYHPGVGTMGAPTATHWLTKEWSRIKGLAFGAGFRDNVLDAYRYLMEVYSDNGGHGNEDRIFIFGFSRGSYTARALAGLLHGYGLLCRGNEGHLPYAWRMYVEQHKQKWSGPPKKHVQPNNAFRQTFSHQNFKIHFLGVWDTVSSVGWIYTPLQLFNVTTNPSIVHARHAVSIDEHRCFFLDNLYDDKDRQTELVQAWFPGVHSDVGGSYTQPQTGMSYESLKWMLAEAEDRGLAVDETRKALVLGDGYPVNLLHYERPVSWKLHKSLKGPWWIPEFIPHGYYNKDFDREYMRVPLGVRLRQLPDNALVHGSVRKRMDGVEAGAQPYHPRNCPKEALIPDPQGLTAMDGTAYWRFRPAPHKKRPLLTWLDRYAVTWFFVIVDIAILVLPLLFVAAVLLDALSIGSFRLGRLGWFWAPTVWHWLSCFGHWLWHWVVGSWHWLRHRTG